MGGNTGSPGDFMSVTPGTDQPGLIKEQLAELAGLRTPCILEGEKIIGLVDSGATVSFVSARLVKDKSWPVSP